MIISYLQEIVRIEKEKGSNELYIRSVLKEYLQILLLQYIYTNKSYKSNFIFTGGTCLRHFYGLERLSEDLDFDMIKQVDVEQFIVDIQEYFMSILKFKYLQISIKQKGRQVLMKFPVLRELGLANESESDLLYIKSDLTLVSGNKYVTEKTAKSVFGYNFVALHYDLSSLFAGKIAAVLNRNLLKGKENREIVKGRDFYDLLWFVKKGVKVNIEFLREKIGENTSMDDLKVNIYKKVELACTKNKDDFKNDLIPFISNTEFINDYVDNYIEEYKRLELLIS